VTVINGSASTIMSVQIAGEPKTTTWSKPLAPSAQASVRLPALKQCAVLVVATFEGGIEGAPGQADICRDKTIRLVD
jgi:hypothetical protein